MSLSIEQWHTHIRTDDNTVTLLHEYAVGLIWDAIQRENVINLPLWNGGLSRNLKENFGVAEIPSSVLPVYGIVPDIAIKNKNGHLIAIIEVVESCYIDENKISVYDVLKKHYIDVIIIDVRNEEDLHTLYKPVENKRNRKELRRPLQKTDDGTIGTTTFQSHEIEDRYSAAVAESNKYVNKLVAAIEMCSPSMRRALKRVLDEIDSPESLITLLPGNPKKEIVERVIRNIRK